jgi:hypothetical protein
MTIEDWSRAFCRRRWLYGSRMGPIQRESYRGRWAGWVGAMDVIFRRLRQSAPPWPASQKPTPAATSETGRDRVLQPPPSR